MPPGETRELPVGDFVSKVTFLQLPGGFTRSVTISDESANAFSEQGCDQFDSASLATAVAPDFHG